MIRRSVVECRISFRGRMALRGRCADELQGTEQLPELPVWKEMGKFCRWLKRRNQHSSIKEKWWLSVITPRLLMSYRPLWDVCQTCRDLGGNMSVWGRTGENAPKDILCGMFCFEATLVRILEVVMWEIEIQVRDCWYLWDPQNGAVLNAVCTWTDVVALLMVVVLKSRRSWALWMGTGSSVQVVGLHVEMTRLDSYV